MVKFSQHRDSASFLILSYSKKTKKNIECILGKTASDHNSPQHMRATGTSADATPRTTANINSSCLITSRSSSSVKYNKQHSFQYI